MLLVKFVGVDCREEAEVLRGAYLEVPREAAHPLPDGYYYFYQLIDLPVYTEEGVFLGYVEELLRTGSNDVWVVRHPEQGREILLPATREVVKAVELEKEEIRVQLPPGLGE
jgi:16S rRNA processing protein RimM